MEKRPSGNPRYANGALRRKYRARLRAMGGPCGICHGRLGPIHYEEPSDSAHPLSFVIDEIKPVSKWRQFGYASPRAAAEDWDNLQPAHYFCNAQKGNKTSGFGRIRGKNSQKHPKSAMETGSGEGPPAPAAAPSPCPSAEIPPMGMRVGGGGIWEERYQKWVKREAPLVQMKSKSGPL